jgi:hypothetical protein
MNRERYDEVVMTVFFNPKTDESVIERLIYSIEELL